MPGGCSGKFLWTQCQIQPSRNNLGVQGTGESIFRNSESLKFKILATMVPPPGHNGFIINFPFWAPQKLEIVDNGIVKNKI